VGALSLTRVAAISNGDHGAAVTSLVDILGQSVLLHAWMQLTVGSCSVMHLSVY